MRFQVSRLWALLSLLLLCAFPCAGSPGPLSAQISPANSTILVNGSQAFAASIAFLNAAANGGAKDITNSAVWSSSNASIATVGITPGTFKGVAAGTVTITVVSGPYRASTKLTVIPNSVALVSITVTPINPSVAKGLGEQFTATGNFADSTTQPLTFAVLWASSLQGVATINSSGLAATHGQGPTTISASFSLNGSPTLTDSTTLTVTAPVITSLVVSPGNFSIPKGLSQQFKAFLVFTDNSTTDVTSAATWSSTNPGVATITSSGLAHANAQGSSNISATNSGFKGSTTFTVLPPVLVSVNINPVFLSLHAQQSSQLSATGIFTDNSTQDLTFSSFWHSDNPAVFVSPSGFVTAIAPGSADITAYNTGLTGTSTVSVASLSSITITPGTPQLPFEKQFQLNATGNFSDGVPEDLTNKVTWASNNPGVITISASGLTTGLVIGASATITAARAGVSGSAFATVVFSTANLYGQYAFSFSGQDFSGLNLAAGSFSADGQGNLSNGLEDFNGSTGVSPNLSFTGTYTVTADGRGQATINDSLGISTFRFVLTANRTGSIVEFDSAEGGGTIEAQDLSAFSTSALHGNYAFLFSGASANGPIAAVGSFFANGQGGISTGLEDVNDTGSFNGSVTFSGSYSIAPNGRGNAAITNSAGTSNFAFYMISAGKARFVSLDFVPALLGAVVGQAGPFNDSVFSGNYVFSDAGVTTSGPVASVGRFAANGAGTVSSGIEDLNDAGSIQQAVSFGGSYNVASSGRGTATLNSGLGTSNFSAYVASPGVVFFLGSDPNEVIIGTAERQQQASFSTASLSGNFGFELDGFDLVNKSPFAVSGQLFSNGAGALFGTEDENELGFTPAPDLSLAGNYSIDATGRGNATLFNGSNFSNFNFYLVSVSEARFIEVDSGQVSTGFSIKQF